MRSQLHNLGPCVHLQVLLGLQKEREFLQQPCWRFCSLANEQNSAENRCEKALAIWRFKREWEVKWLESAKREDEIQQLQQECFPAGQPVTCALQYHGRAFHVSTRLLWSSEVILSVLPQPSNVHGRKIKANLFLTSLLSVPLMSLLLNQREAFSRKMLINGFSLGEEAFSHL